MKKQSNYLKIILITIFYIIGISIVSLFIAYQIDTGNKIESKLNGLLTFHFNENYDKNLRLEFQDQPFSIGSSLNLYPIKNKKYETYVNSIGYNTDNLNDVANFKFSICNSVEFGENSCDEYEYQVIRTENYFKLIHMKCDDCKNELNIISGVTWETGNYFKNSNAEWIKSN